MAAAANNLNYAIRSPSTRFEILSFASSAEDEVWQVLWRDVRKGQGKVRLVNVLGRSMLQRFPFPNRNSVSAGRLVYVSPFGDKVKRLTKETAVERNRVAALLADKVFVPHASAESSTLQLVKQLISWNIPVSTLEQTSNASLIALGATIIHSA